MKRLALLLLVLGGCSCATATPMAYKGIRIRPAVLRQLADVHDEFERETAWCLTGSTKDGVVTIDDLSAADVTNQTAISATFDCSASPGTVAFAHNHPKSALFCRPSSTDIESMDRLRYDVLLISCDGGVFIYRFRGEGELYRIAPHTYGRSVPPSPEAK